MEQLREPVASQEQATRVRGADDVRQAGLLVDDGKFADKFPGAQLRDQRADALPYHLNPRAAPRDEVEPEPRISLANDVIARRILTDDTDARDLINGAIIQRLEEIDPANQFGCRVHPYGL